MIVKKRLLKRNQRPFSSEIDQRIDDHASARLTSKYRHTATSPTKLTTHISLTASSVPTINITLHGIVHKSNQ